MALYQANPIGYGAQAGRISTGARSSWGGDAPSQPVDPFFASTEDLQKSFKKSSRETESRIASDRSLFMDHLGTDEEDERMSDADFQKIGGQMRGRADAAAAESIAATSRRLGGDTSSPLFQMISTGAAGGAAAATGAAQARLRLDESQSLRQNRTDRARALLGLFNVEQGARQLNLQTQGFQRGIFESDRNFANTLNQQQNQLRMFALQNPDPFGSQFGGSMGGVSSAARFLGV